MTFIPPEDLLFEPVTALSARIHAGELRLLDLVNAYLERIQQHNPHINAYITVMAEAARADAERLQAELDSGRDRGPLHGIPFAIKDNIDVFGVRCTSGSAILRDAVAQADARLVAQLREAGAILLGKTNLHEFAQGATTINRFFGATRNPLDLTLIAGGSSGGSAAALAAGLCAAAIGTDTGGSVRLPAVFCDAVGLRPAPGMLSTTGIFPVSHLLDTPGPITRSSADAALIMGALGRPLSLEGHRVEGLRVAVTSPERLNESDFAPAWLGVRGAEHRLQRGGATTFSARDLPEFKPVRRAAGVISACESLEIHREWFEERSELYSPELYALLERATKHSADELAEARSIVLGFEKHMREYFAAGVDLLLLPVSPVEPPLVDAPDPEAVKQLLRFTFPISASALPVLARPAFSANEGRYGVQWVGPDLPTLFRAVLGAEAVRW